MVLLTGVLLGLGGPFWFQIVSRITQIRQAVRGGAPAAAVPASTAAEPATTDQRLALLGQPAAT